MLSAPSLLSSGGYRPDYFSLDFRTKGNSQQKSSCRECRTSKIATAAVSLRSQVLARVSFIRCRLGNAMTHSPIVSSHCMTSCV